jgi:hypothetical protein
MQKYPTYSKEHSIINKIGSLDTLYRKDISGVSVQVSFLNVLWSLITVVHTMYIP